MDKQALLDRLQTVLRQPSIPFSVLHGSVAAERDTPVSDVDVAVYVEERDRFLRLVVALSRHAKEP